MTFLNPAILWGLTAISIPILIHLFNLRKTKKIEFSTLMFLKEIQQTKYRKIRLKQLLILLCRILMLIFIVMAFSKPFQKGYISSTSEKARSSVLLVLDNSLSMEVKSDSGSAFDNAKQKMIETVKLLNDNDEIYFTTTSEMGRNNSKIFYDNKDALSDSIKSSKISPITNSLDYILFYSDRILNNSTNAIKELFFFTDGQKSMLTGQNNSFSEINKDENIKYNFVLCGKRRGNNISIDTINIVSKIFQKNKPIKLKCSVHNHNNFNSVNNTLALNIFGDNKTRDEKAVDIPPNSTVDVEFSFIPSSTGFSGGYIETNPSNSGPEREDEIISDNKRFFSYRIPEKVNILAVSGNDKDMDFIKLALNSSEDMSKDSTGSKTSYINLKQANENALLNELNNKNNKFDCILIVNKRNFNEQEANMLYDFIQNGGGLLIYPGDNTDVSNYNTIFFKKFDLSGINGTFGNKSASNSSDMFKFEKVDLNHPVFEGIFQRNNNEQSVFIKESPLVKAGFNIIGGINSIPLIKLNNGVNFLEEYSSGKGKILLFAVPPNMNYSDFPSKNIFPPVTVRSILYLSNINTIKEAVAGKDYFMDIANFNLNEKDSIFIRNNSDTKSKSLLTFTNSQGSIDVKDYINNISTYSVFTSQKTLLEIPVNFDKAESVPDKLNATELTSYLETNYKIKPNVISPEQNYEASISQIRSGRELWKYFLVIALSFVIIEYLISRFMFSPKKENKTT